MKYLEVRDNPVYSLSLLHCAVTLGNRPLSVSEIGGLPCAHLPVGEALQIKQHGKWSGRWR